MSGKKDSIRLILTIAERGQGKSLLKFYSDNRISCHYQTTGLGTASSELLDVLGFGTSERDILISLADKRDTKQLFEQLTDAIKGRIHAKGIVISMPVTGLNNLITMALLGQNMGEVPEGGEEVEQHMRNSLILVAVNQGHTEEVMNTARSAGARGGTIIRARWAGPQETEKFYGITLQAEKEIIVIVAYGQQHSAIMEIINKKHGLKTEACAMICSVGLEDIARLS